MAVITNNFIGDHHIAPGANRWELFIYIKNICKIDLNWQFYITGLDFLDSGS